MHIYSRLHLKLGLTVQLCTFIQRRYDCWPDDVTSQYIKVV